MKPAAAKQLIVNAKEELFIAWMVHAYQELYPSLQQSQLKRMARSLFVKFLREEKIPFLADDWSWDEGAARLIVRTEEGVGSEAS